MHQQQPPCSATRALSADCSIQGILRKQSMLVVQNSPWQSLALRVNHRHRLQANILLCIKDVNTIKHFQAVALMIFLVVFKAYSTSTCCILHCNLKFCSVSAPIFLRLCEFHISMSVWFFLKSALQERSSIVIPVSQIINYNTHG